MIWWLICSERKLKVLFVVDNCHPPIVLEDIVLLFAEQEKVQAGFDELSVMFLSLAGNMLSILNYICQ
ncbi:hypothetical protein M8C21_000825 [Ambrosia artemisiifolia]|uniref:Uncharacterized protein n=1 Tax=Ambrosia artemisiifolia TaxID=4212 RepID=A0AAD5CIB0_AMBAR|nr:hypothetical protein M8C21_000825 [Ambrosia artemisiifolia]